MRIHRTPGALALSGLLQLGNDLGNRGGVRIDRERDVGLAERAIALAAAGEIEFAHRDALALDIPPDIELRPGQQRMYSHMHLGRKIGLIVIPEFGRLVAKVPASVGPARTEDALLAADQLLVAANT